MAAAPPQCTAIASTAPPTPCVYAFGAPTYLRFDLTPLAAAYLSCTLPDEPTLKYLLALCASLPASVTGTCGPSSSIQALNNSGACLGAFGAAASANATVLEHGLALAYASAQQCGAGGAPYATALALTCAPELPPGALLVDALAPSAEGSGCGLQYSARTAAACGVVVARVVAPLGTAAAVLLALGGALVLYVVGGTLYNRRARGARGLEAVPHIGALRAAAGGVAWAAQRATCGACGSCGAGGGKSGGVGGGGGGSGGEYGELAAQEGEGDAYFTSQ